MAFDIVLFGRLTLSTEAMEHWLASSASPTLPWAQGDLEAPRAPEAWLTALREMALQPHELVEALCDRNTLTVSAFVGQEHFVSVRNTVGRLFISAAEHHAHGELTVMGYSGLILGEMIRVGRGRARLTKMTLTDVKAATASADFTQLEGRIHHRFNTLVGHLDGPRAGINPFTGRLAG